MSVEKISPEDLAKLFHQYHRTLAPIFECDTTSIPADWDEARPKERKLMIATARLVLSDLESLQRRPVAKPSVEGEEPTRPYFARPGHAEWGC